MNERREDVPLLVRHILRNAAARGDAVPQGGALECLRSEILPGFAGGVPPIVAGGKVFVPAAASPAGVQYFIRVFKLGTGATGFDDCNIHTPPPPNCMGLVFKGQNAQGFTTTPDWAPGHYKAECPQSQGGLGLSVDTSPDPTLRRARALYCGREFTTYFNPHSNCRSLNVSSSSVGWSTDWDPSFFKGECNSGEYVAGVAQSTSGALTHLLCCPGTGLGKTACAKLTVNSTNVNEDGAFSWHWDAPNQITPPSAEAECGAGRYMAGVSRYPNATGAGHAIYCCTR